MNKRIRTEYPPEFKLQAVERAQMGDRSVRSLEHELGLSENLLRSWVQAYDRQGAQAFVRKVGIGNAAGGAPSAAGSESAAGAKEQQRGLEQRVAQLERENAILKKALALLSRDQLPDMP